MTAQEMAQILGRIGEIRIAGITVHVRVIDVKMAYGVPRYQVEPLAGSGNTWVQDITLLDLPTVVQVQT